MLGYDKYRLAESCLDNWIGSIGLELLQGLEIFYVIHSAFHGIL